MTPTILETMRSALEAMEFANDTCLRNIGIGVIDINAITNLRAAIEELELDREVDKHTLFHQDGELGLPRIK